MKKISGIMIIAAALLSVAATGYWFGTRVQSAPVAASAKAERKVLYYRDPMGLPDTSPVPKKDAMGMAYVPVYAGDAEEGGQSASSFDTSGGSGQVSISVEKVQKLGVKSEAASLRMLDKTVRAAGRVEIDERRTYTIAPKFEGWVERLYVNTGGQLVGRGQPLFDVYSPELVSAQREYAIAAQGEAALDNADVDARSSMKQLAAASLARLKNWDISEAQLRQLANGKSRRGLTYYAPVSGIVLEKKAVQGMRFMPGEVLYQIADLSSVWVVAEVAEQDIGLVKVGSVAQVKLDAYPDKSFAGKVAFIYPTLNSATRTVQVRVEIANPKGLLKPAMFASVALAAGNGGKVLAVPASAVIDSGTRQIVLVQLAQGRFEPRIVKLGARSDDYVEVLEGIAEGEQVVTSANFLIDAESNLKAALSGMSAAEPSIDVGRASARQHQDKQVGLKPDLPKRTVGHQAQGILNAVNADGTVNITFDAIKTLGMPGMTMDFALANSALAAGIQPGSAVSFEIVERKPGEWLVTGLQAKPGKAHEGH